MKVERQCGAPCETEELRELIRLRTKYRRDMRTNRALGTDVSQLITEHANQNQYKILHDHLQRMTEEKYTSATWNVVKSLNSEASTQTGNNANLLGR